MKKRIAIVIVCLAAMSASAQTVPVSVNTNTGEIWPPGLNWTFPALTTTSFWMYAENQTSIWTTAGSGGGTTSGIASGTIELIYEYPEFSRWTAGTVYVQAWDNRQMFGSPVWEYNFVTTNLRQQVTVTVDNDNALTNYTFWYSYMDVDGDTYFNQSSTASSATEPGGLAEHNPQQIPTNGGVAVTFLMTDVCPMTWRLGVSSNTIWAFDYLLTIDYSGVQEWGYGTSQDPGLRARTWICETDYWYMNDFGTTNHSWGGFYHPTAYSAISSHLFRDVSSGVAAGQQYYNTQPFDDVFGTISVTGGKAVPTYPVNGETVTSSDVEFVFTNAWTLYTAMYLQVFDQGPGTNSIYEYKGYMEREHINGETKHYMREGVSTGGPVTPVGPSLTPGSNYWWHMRASFGDPDNGTHTQADWSVYGEFYYTNSP